MITSHSGGEHPGEVRVVTPCFAKKKKFGSWAAGPLPSSSSPFLPLSPVRPPSFPPPCAARPRRPTAPLRYTLRRISPAASFLSPPRSIFPLTRSHLPLPSSLHVRPLSPFAIVADPPR